jgi:hypothetical protein
MRRRFEKSGAGWLPSCQDFAKVRTNKTNDVAKHSSHHNGIARTARDALPMDGRFETVTVPVDLREWSDE